MFRWCQILALALSPSAQDLFLAQNFLPGEALAKGGLPCVACGLVMTVAVEDSQVVPRLEKLLLGACKSNRVCEVAVHSVLKLVERRVSPDDICSSVTLCDKSCHLFGEGEWPVDIPDAPHQDPPNTGRRLLSNEAIFSVEETSEFRRAFHAAGLDGSSAPRDLAGSIADVLLRLHGESSLDEVIEAAAVKAASEALSSHPCGGNPKCIIDRFANLHLPIFDSDTDAFGPVHARGLRGSHWRGADCNDFNSEIYPGRRAGCANCAAGVDHDCNGIYGVNATGSFEDLLCSEVSRRGLIHLGDSATAHFHAPPQWLSINSSGWNLDNLLNDVLDEGDQPACAWGTGYKESSQCPWAAGRPSFSIAERLRQRNRCNHRDFQNIGVNGARLTHSAEHITSMARNSTLDHPALVIFSFIGNDVCNGHPGTTHMTPPEAFKTQVLARLSDLDAKLPPGSAVLMVGLVDGRVLYDTMHDVQHPVGAKTKDVYDYLNCNDVSPCLGWLNTNATLRDLTSAWAQTLNDEYEAIIASGVEYENFELQYFSPDWRALIQVWVDQGGSAADIIERTDGFHPSQLGNDLLAEKIWNHLETNFPSAIGDVNPHNAEIKGLFGDQGGF